MLKYSNEEIEQISYKKINANFYRIYLRENINILKDGKYSFNEYSLIRRYEDENLIVDDVKNNFDNLLENAKLNEELENKEKEIERLKNSLTDSDYKVLKCTENFILGSVLPYDFSQLLSERTEVRNKINKLQSSEKLDADKLAELELEEEKNKKITELCACAQSTITSGIDFNNEHYRLNTTDQINLTSLYSLALLGNSVPYHADGKVCRIFSANEMIALVQTSIKYITYHTTYYNLLKNQVLEYTNIEDVKKSFYGMQLKEDYQFILDYISKK